MKKINEPISLSDYQALMFEQIVPINELRDYKNKPLEQILTFWRRKKLLPFVDTRKWIKLSCAQLMWIRILDDLRKINFPVEKMQLVCNYFFQDAYDNELPRKNIEFNRKEIKKKKIAGTQTPEEEKLLSRINDMLSDDTFLYAMRFDINYLTNLVAHVIAGAMDGLIYIFFDGSVAEFIGENYVGHTKCPEDLTPPSVRLSISHYLREFIEDNKISDIMMSQLLNDDEVKVLREMRNKNIKEILITVTGDEKRKIESTEAGVIKNDEAKEIKKLLGLKNYERITINTIDEKSLSFKVTRKRI